MKACRKEEISHLLALGLILLCAVGLRASFLSQPMRCDESFTFVHYASQPLHIGLSDYSYPNNHVFHTFLVHLVYMLFGNHTWAIRLPAFVAGILVVPASYLFTRLFYGRQAALFAAGLVAASSALVEYSVNARGYTLVCVIFLFLFSLAAYLKDRADRAPWFAFAFLSALGFYTIPVMLYPFGVVVSWLLLTILYEQTQVSRTALLKNLALSCAATGVLTAVCYAPVLTTGGWKALANNPFVASKPFVDFALQFLDSLRAVWNLWNRDIPAPLHLLFVACFGVSLVLHTRLSCFRASVIVAAVVWLVPILLIQRVVPWARIWLFLHPLYLALCAAGLVALLRFFAVRLRGQASTGFAAVALALSLGLSANVVRTQSVLTSTETGILWDAEAITQFLKEELQPGDRLVAESPSFETLEYYFLLHGVPVQPFFADVKTSRRVLAVVNKTVAQDLEKLLASAAVPRMEFSAPGIIREFESATLYRMTRNWSASGLGNQ